MRARARARERARAIARDACARALARAGTRTGRGEEDGHASALARGLHVASKPAGMREGHAKQPHGKDGQKLPCACVASSQRPIVRVEMWCQEAGDW